MGLIERKVLGTVTASKEGTVFGSFFDSALFQAVAPQITSLSFSSNVVLESIQTNIVSVVLPNLNNSIKRETQVQMFRGPMFVFARGQDHKFVGTSSDQVQIDLRNNPSFTFPGKGLKSVGPGLFEDGGGGFILVLSFARPHSHSVINQFGSTIGVWHPYSIIVEVTGFEKTEFAQDTGGDEELVSALVEDLRSKELYEDRIAVDELQSDFIETQVQAIRAGEALLWNKNKVIQARFLTLFNPSVKRGSTIRVLNINNNIIFQGVVKTVGHLFDIEEGDAVTEIIATATEYVFQSFLGESQEEEKPDRRQ